VPDALNTQNLWHRRNGSALVLQSPLLSWDAAIQPLLRSTSFFSQDSLASVPGAVRRESRGVRTDAGGAAQWAAQGVFMLNAVLTVRAHAAASHAKQGCAAACAPPCLRCSPRPWPPQSPPGAGPNRNTFTAM